MELLRVVIATRLASMENLAPASELRLELGEVEGREGGWEMQYKTKPLS